MELEEVIKQLKSCSDPKAVEGMARFGINPKNTYGVSVPILRKIAKTAGKNHVLAKELWATEIHEARILASMVEDVDLVTEAQMDRWIKDFNSWDVCDQVCMNLFDKTPFAYNKAVEWSKRESEFEKRAGFAMIACLAWHDKEAPDRRFEHFFPLIKSASTDGRNFVKKSVNWALRQIGKRSLALNKKAIRTAKDIQKLESSSAKWIAKDAIRELESDAVKKRLSKR